MCRPPLIARQFRLTYGGYETKVALAYTRDSINDGSVCDGGWSHHKRAAAARMRLCGMSTQQSTCQFISCAGIAPHGGSVARYPTTNLSVDCRLANVGNRNQLSKVEPYPGEVKQIIDGTNQMVRPHQIPLLMRGCPYRWDITKNPWSRYSGLL